MATVDPHSGLKKVKISASEGGSAEIFLHGGHITSWKASSGEELIFVSEKAIFKPPKAIRGGVPVCFPQFGGLGPLGQHGFARNSEWSLVSSSSDSATLEFDPSEEQLKTFPHPFKLSTTVTVGKDTLKQSLKVTNTGQGKLSFTTALHTYLRVSAIDKVSVEGLKGLEYYDNTDRMSVKSEASGAVQIGGEVDRIYKAAPNEIRVVDAGRGRAFVLEKHHFPDAVLWNPWADKAAGMADFGDEEYKGMVCLEPAAAKSGPMDLSPGASWEASQTLTLAKL